VQENPVQCAESLRVQAWFDGELDALSAADVERHLERCAECRALREDLQRARELLRSAPVERAPPELRARVAHRLDAESAAERRAERAAPGRKRVWWPSRRVPPFWAGAATGLAAAACAAIASWFMVSAAAPATLLDGLVAAHVRSLMPAHLTDVVSTDRHTVKPWFAGHADVSPVVADFAAQGYRLVGGRADYFDGRRAAVVVYEHGPHVINVFSWAGAGRHLPAHAIRNGYHIACWSLGNVQYCAVSDTGWTELQDLVSLLRDLGARDARE
jgi:anti-sigma factor (TIGR02949 family)